MISIVIVYPGCRVFHLISHNSMSPWMPHRIHQITEMPSQHGRLLRLITGSRTTDFNVDDLSDLSSLIEYAEGKPIFDVQPFVSFYQA